MTSKQDFLTGISLYKGNTSEAIVLAAYIQAGFLVSVPFGGGAPYDLIVDTGTRLLKVQVKTGKLEAGYVIYQAKRHRGSKLNAYSRYTEREVDVFTVWCPDNRQIYAVPTGMSLTNQVRLRVVEAQNFQEKKIKWARDFTWDIHVANLQTEKINSELGVSY